MHQHNFTLNDLDNMMPWEREIYISLLTAHIQEQNERNKQRKNG
jgi:hypothetical protein